MEDVILFSQLNDFIFCPASIYYHNLYENTEAMLYQCQYQIAGTKAHKALDTGTYSCKKGIYMALPVYCEKYGLLGKIDLFDNIKSELTERKRTVKKIYDGYVFQLYAQYYALTEMGYSVKRLKIHSITDNKNYYICLPEENLEMNAKFERVIYDMRNFSFKDFYQENAEKCKNCIYAPSCGGRTE